MKEINSIIQAYDAIAAQQKLALATVIHVQDSSYRRSGARMLIQENGTWTGGISGGCLEGDTLLKAKYVLVKNQATIVRYDTREDDPNQIGVGLGCNGLIDVLIAPLSPENNPIEVLRTAASTRVPRVLLTFVKSESDKIPEGNLYPLEEIEQLENELESGYIALIKECAQEVLQGKRSRICIYKNWSVFVEFLAPAIHLYIFGKNYDAIPLAQLAKAIGWQVTVVANPSKVSKQLYQIADSVHSSAKGIPKMDNYSVALLMSHDYQTDLNHFIRLQTHFLRYIGILGPRKRTIKIFDELTRKGIAYQEANVYAPIGLDTGATSPEEIAIAILAEIRTVFAERQGGLLRNKDGAIHKRS